MDNYPNQYATPGGEPPNDGRQPRRGLSIFGFPLRVDPFFFVTAWLIGGRQEPQWMVVWIVVVITGVLAHELGHAFAGRRLGMQPWIRLMAFGGMTGWMRPRVLTPWQQIGISVAGPAVGITIGGTALLAVLGGFFADGSGTVLRIANFVVWVNLGWGVLNLLPILPLDGGHITSSLAEMVAGRRGRIAARAFSVVLTVAIGLWALSAGDWWILILCAVFTYANVQALRAETALG
jgi:membrane-associated protease RseP (regulator of RpoE activity)